MKKLKSLRLSFNKITTIDNGKLPISLEKIYLENNRIKIIPEEIFRLKKLRVLGLRNNKIEKIPSKLKTMTNLTHILIAGNKAKIPKYFDEMLCEASDSSNDDKSEYEW